MTVIVQRFKRSKTAVLLGLLCYGLLTGAGEIQSVACPKEDAKALEWLDKMSRSTHQVNYQGVVTLQRSKDDLQVMQVSHSVSQGSRSEQLTQLTGQGAQVTRADHPLECLHPGHQLLELGATLQSGDCGIAKFYRFSMAKGERIAGRKAVRIKIEPKDMYRFGYVMEVDHETALLLKTSTIGHSGKTLERFQFAKLTYSETLPEGAEVDVVHEAQHSGPDIPDTQSYSTRHWAIGWLPPGFTPTDAPASNAARKTYTDGLAVFSVFMEELERGIQPGEGVVRNGSTTSYSRGMQIAGQSILTTVIGEVPVNTARMVADSISWTH